MKKQVASALLGMVIATSAHAWQAGDVMVRAGAAGVFPTGDGTIVPSGTVEADDAWSLGISLTWMATSTIGVGVLGAWPFEHDVEAKGALADLGTVAETKHLPPTVTLQYHLDTGSRLHPYAGIGINYTNFFDTETKGDFGDPAVLGASLDLDDSWGLAGELGVDYELQNDWLVGAQVFYIDIDTDATITGSADSGVADVDGTFNVEIDPWVFMVSAGKKF